MEKYIIMSLEDGELLDDESDEKAALKSANDYLEGIELDEDGGTAQFEIGIYKMVKIVRVTRKTTKTIVAVK